MTQPLWTILLCFGLIAALHQSARLDAAPISPAEIAQTSPELAHQFQQLGRDYRIQIYNNFRLDRAQYDRRRAAWDVIRGHWQKSGGRLEAKQVIIRWLHDGIRSSATGSIAPMPPLPELEDVVPRYPKATPPIASQKLESPRKGVTGLVESPLGSQPIPLASPTRVRASDVSPIPRKRSTIMPLTGPRKVRLPAKAGVAPNSPAAEVSRPKSLNPQVQPLTPRPGQQFSPVRGSITVAPRMRANDFAISRLRPIRPITKPNVLSDGPKTVNRAPTPGRPVAPSVAPTPSQSLPPVPSVARQPAVKPQSDTSPARGSSEPLPSSPPTPRVTRRLTIEPHIDRLPPRRLSEPILNRGPQLIESPLRDSTLTKTILRSSRKSASSPIPPNHLAAADRQPIRNRRPAPATAIELPAPVPQQAAEEHAEVNLIELVAHIAGYDRGLKTLENRLLLSMRWAPEQLAQEVAELANLARRRETITLYLQLLASEVRQTLPKLNTASTAAELLKRRIRETREIVNRGSFPAVGDENRLDREILAAASRKLSELTRPAEQP